MCVLNTENKCDPCATFKFARFGKQREVFQYLDYNMKEFSMTSTDIVPLGLKDCGDKERPDGLWDTHPTRVIGLEVDENQHKERNCACEQICMINIAQALGAGQAIFVRYNPDTFKSSESGNWPQSKRLKLLKE